MFHVSGCGGGGGGKRGELGGGLGVGSRAPL